MDPLSAKIRKSFPEKRIVIVGDLVADQFLHGTIARVSREAPVFILRHDETDTRAGAAGKNDGDDWSRHLSGSAMVRRGGALWSLVDSFKAV